MLTLIPEVCDAGDHLLLIDPFVASLTVGEVIDLDEASFIEQKAEDDSNNIDKPCAGVEVEEGENGESRGEPGEHSTSLGEVIKEDQVKGKEDIISLGDDANEMSEVLDQGSTFGDFGGAEEESHVEKETIEDDFGDFGDGGVTLVTDGASNTNAVQDQVLADREGVSDDEFGDFGDAMTLESSQEGDAVEGDAVENEFGDFGDTVKVVDGDAESQNDFDGFGETSGGTMATDNDGFGHFGDIETPNSPTGGLFEPVSPTSTSMATLGLGMRAISREVTCTCVALTKSCNDAVCVHRSVYQN